VGSRRRWTVEDAGVVVGGGVLVGVRKRFSLAKVEVFFFSRSRRVTRRATRRAIDRWDHRSFRGCPW
jgi:hypothetical protein